MVTLYFVRHCETKGNATRCFQGHIDCDINENGQKQLNCLEKRFNRVHIDEIYTSPMIRAQKTAKAIKGSKDTKITVMPLLIEMDGGDIEGMPFDEIYKKYPVIENYWFDEPEKYYSPGGESMEEIYERSKQAITEICEKNEGKTVALASHGGFFRTLMCYIYYGDIKKLRSTPWFDNTGVTKCVYNKGRFEIKYYNSVSHLSKDLLPEHSKIVAERSPE